MGRKKIDMIGKKFGKILVLENIENKTINDSSKVKCLCDCGNIKSIRSLLLRKGIYTDCGCVRIRRNSFLKHELFVTWKDMNSRCYYPKAQYYKNYGGRGIKVCDRWRNKINGLENFINDMGDRPKGYSLDRKDNNKDYSPRNCRWATNTQQCRNRTNNRLFEYKGVSRSIAEWCEIYKIKYSSFYSRTVRGWSIEKILETPIKKII